jgi:hypothetical protein
MRFIVLVKATPQVFEAEDFKERAVPLLRA